MNDLARKPNDVGGEPAAAIDRAEHPQTLFEERVDALVMLLTNPRIGAFQVDALRRAIEELSPEEYATLGYYEKWLRAVRKLLVEQEVLTEAEIEDRLVRLRSEAAHG